MFEMPKNVLILGDGNFSFSLALAKDRKLFLKNYWWRNHPSLHTNQDLDIAENCVPTTTCREFADGILFFATSFDPLETLVQHGVSKENITALREIGNVCILHNVDARNLHRTFNNGERSKTLFKNVIFNFPHVGGKSNINACKGLLEDFFYSVVDFLDKDGLVFVTLCKGQGGTPLDAGRNGYGNSWQVATQAAKAGFILCEVIPFESLVPSGYEPAGYRGNLHKGFVKQQSFTYVFKKEKQIIIPEIRIFTCGSSVIAETDHFLQNDLRQWNPFAIPRHPFSICLSYVQHALDDLYGGLHSSSINSDFRCLVRSSIATKLDLQSCFDCHHLNSPVTSFGCMLIDTATEVSPSSYPVKPEVVIVDSSLTLFEFATKLHIAMESIFQKHLVQLSFKDPATHSVADGNFQNEISNVGDIDLKEVPNFLEDINMQAWLSFAPEVTITKDENNISDSPPINRRDSQTQPKYHKVPFEEYSYSDTEAIYFGLNGKSKFSFEDCFEGGQILYDIKVNNISVAHLGSLITDTETSSKGVKETEKHHQNLCVLRPDLLCMALLNINDLRLLWLKDTIFLEHLSQCMVDGLLPSAKVLHPLCYRHDLCFWVRGGETEGVLMAALRHCCLGTVHSVRLVRILRHEETNLLSFCYRIIYSRCDGPLSQRESVELQNRLRLLLIDLDFDLR